MSKLQCQNAVQEAPGASNKFPMGSPNIKENGLGDSAQHLSNVEFADHQSYIRFPVLDMQGQIIWPNAP